MKREIVWAPEALRDVAEQLAYIAADDKRAAQRVFKAIRGAAEALAERPIGRRGRVSGTYEKSVLKTRYVIAYDLSGERQVHILRVIHTARDWPAGSWPKA